MEFTHQPLNGKQLTDEDIKKMIEEYDVQFIKLQFVDINGQVKNLAVPSEHIDLVTLYSVHQRRFARNVGLISVSVELAGDSGEL